jgi:N-acetylneuraminic acid mutarotase
MTKGKKTKTADKQARTLAKQSKKAAKGQKKARIKDAGLDDSDDSGADQVDLDAVLAAYAQEQAKFLKVTEEPCEPPSPRSSSTILASPSNRNELFVFGGEYYDGTTARFFNDLFVYLIERGEWRQVKSPNSPLPRSGHAWCRGGNTGGIYLFGGEFSSPRQGTFHHYNDFWHLDPASREWTRVESKKQGPPARSGHRLTYFKNFIILFGGFQDTSQQTRYLQDLWVYDCQKYVWYEAKLAPASQKPDPRSSFSFLPHESGAVLYGGYSRVRTTSAVGKSSKAGVAQRNILKPLIHQDTWFLRIAIPEATSQVDTSPLIRWERRKKPANPPNPARAGATMAHHKGRGILFAGVHDVEESEEGIDSEFFNALFAWNSDRNRFFPLNLRRPKTTPRRQQAASSRARDRGKANEEDLLRNLAALETRGSVEVKEDLLMDIDEASHDDIEQKEEEKIRFELPHRRFNAQVTVQDDILFIFGGTFEIRDQEFTFNDMYSIDLVKLDGVREIFFREPDNWSTKVEDEPDSEDKDEDESLSEEEDEGDAMLIDAASTAPTEDSVPPDEAEIAVNVEKSSSAKDDPRPFPRPFENLRAFFIRTSTEWQSLLMAAMKPTSSNVANESSIKELRRKAFDDAEERWWDCREEVRALEDEQEDAGIGEVISITDRGAEIGGGRRR